MLSVPVCIMHSLIDEMDFSNKIIMITSFPVKPKGVVVAPSPPNSMGVKLILKIFLFYLGMMSEPNLTIF